MGTKTRGKGEGSVYQRADGYWVGQVDLGRDANGKRRRPRIVRKLKEDVLAEMGRLAAGPSVDRTVTVATYLEFWVTEVAAGQVTASSLAEYTKRIDRVVPLLGHVRLAKLGKAQIQKLVNRLAESYAPKTVQTTMATLRQALDWGVPDYLERNPAVGVRGPRQVTARVDDALTADETAAVLAAAVGDRYEALYWLALTYGLRIGELLGLDWADVDIDGATVTVVRAKTAAGERTLPLIPDAVAKLREHRRRWPAITGPVFTGPDGGTLKAQRVRGWWSELLARSGVEHRCRNCGTDRACSSSVRRFHASRHTAATLLLEAGLELEVVSKILGHSNIGVTADIYVKVRADLMRRRMSSLG